MFDGVSFLYMIYLQNREYLCRTWYLYLQIVHMKISIYDEICYNLQAFEIFQKGK